MQVALEQSTAADRERMQVVQEGVQSGGVAAGKPHHQQQHEQQQAKQQRSSGGAEPLTIDESDFSIFSVSLPGGNSGAAAVEPTQACGPAWGQWQCT